MKRFLLLAVSVLACSTLARAQTPEQKQQTVAYLRSLQTAEGGFLPGKSAGEPATKPTLGATGSALRALNYFGGDARDRDAAARFIEQCLDQPTGGFADQPGGKPGTITTDVGILAAVEVKVPRERYAAAALRYVGAHSRSFEEIRMAAAAVEALGKRPPEADQWLAELARLRNPDGTFGKGDALTRETGSAVAAELRLGVTLSDERKRHVLRAIQEGQRSDGGYGEGGKPGSDLATSYRVTRSLHMLHELPANVAALRSLIARCRNEDGGYGVAPGQPSSVSGTYFAGSILHWLDAGAAKLVLVAGGDANLQGPFGVATDSAGNLYVVEYTGHRVRRIDPKGVVTTVAGTGRKGFAGDGDSALKAEFDSMHSLAVQSGDDLYLADTLNNRVRRIHARSGIIVTIAGTGAKGFGGDGGPAKGAQFGNIYCLAFDASGEKLYLADLDNRRIRMIDLTASVVTTVAGNGKKGVPEDGALAINAPLVDLRAVAVDGQGNLYILERSGNALRVVDPQGKIRTVAGTGKQGATGDGGPAVAATFNGPKHLCIDRDGTVLIADTENHAIRRYLPTEGKIVRVAGSGQKGSAGLGGPPEQAELNQPHGVHVNPRTGDLYIADSSNNRVVKIER